MDFFVTASLHTDIPDKEKKGRDLTQYNTKRNLLPLKTPESIVTTQPVTKTFDYTATADRLMKVSWSEYSHHNGVVKPFLRDNNLSTFQKSFEIKGMHISKFEKIYKTIIVIL